MHRLRTFLLPLLTAAALLLGVAGSQAATITSGGAINASGSLAFSSRAIAIRCAVTLGESIATGTFATGDTIGTVTGVTNGGCTPTGRVIAGPDITLGALPSAGLRKLTPIALLATIAGSNCYWAGTLASAANGTSLTVDPTSTLVLDPTQPLVAPFCSSLGNVTVRGTLTLSSAIGFTLP